MGWRQTGCFCATSTNVACVLAARTPLRGAVFRGAPWYVWYGVSLNGAEVVAAVSRSGEHLVIEHKVAAVPWVGRVARRGGNLRRVEKRHPLAAFSGR
jgi:hypothetical protein